MTRKLEDVIARRRKIRDARYELIEFLDKLHYFQDLLFCCSLAVSNPESVHYFQNLTVLPHLQRRLLDEMEADIVEAFRILNSLD